jgi:hypothetical protein
VRVVSLLPSATEIVYALGMDEHLVGVTFECDEPAAARTDMEGDLSRGRVKRCPQPSSWTPLR